MDSNPGKRPTTAATDAALLRLHILPTLGHRPIGSITPADIQRQVNEWAAEHAPRTVKRTYGTLRAIINYAVNLDLIGRTPCRGIRLPFAEREERHIVDADDLVRLAEAVGPAYAPMVYLGAVLGLRWGECAGLRVGRIDFLRRRLTVAVQRTHTTDGQMVEGPPKSREGRRDLSVPDWLLDLLGAHLQAREG